MSDHKIRDLQAFPVTVGARTQLLVKIETTSGVHGWGEAGLTGREYAVAGALRHYRQTLLGQDAFDIGRIWQELYRSQYFEGGRVLQAALSAIDIALYDIKGKALGVPVYELLGGRQRNIVPTFASTSAPPGPEMIEQAKQLIDSGWRAIRLSPAGFSDEVVFEPREQLGETAHWLRQAREALGQDVALGIDMHHRLSVAEAVSFCQRLPPGTIDFLEEPIRAESMQAYAALRRMTDIPFAIGEEFSSKWQALPFVEADIHQFNRLDLGNIGGLTEAMKVAGWSEAHYVDMMPHNPLGPICTAANIHYAAAVPNFAWLETRASPAELHLGFDDAELFPVQPRLTGSVYPVSDAPGLGIVVDETVLSCRSYDPWEAPHLKRRDGSVTNW